MKIAESTVQLYSDTTYLEEIEKKESLTIWKNGEVMQADSNGRGLSAPVNVASQLVEGTDTLTLSQEAMRSRRVTVNVEDGVVDDDVMADLNIRILKELVERFTGKKIDITRPPDNTTVVESVGNQGSEVRDGEGTDEFGLAYELHESYLEQEKMTFTASGKILTEDGAELDLEVQVSMSREFYSEQNVNIRAGSALKDPLVINFTGEATELTHQKFSFDIDADGHEDHISFVKPGSGLLALDMNDDGVINDGSELFGAMTGSGFSELKEYDGDGNNWIDENDSIYDRLRIWTKSSSGEDALLSLGQKGVGALYLGNISSPFSIKTSDNELLGQVRSTGMFLREEGGGGTLQQIDLVV